MEEQFDIIQEYKTLLQRVDDPRGLDERTERVAADILYALHRAPYEASGGNTKFGFSLSETYRNAYGPFERHPTQEDRVNALQNYASEIVSDAQEKLFWCDEEGELPYIPRHINQTLSKLDTAATAYQDIHQAEDAVTAQLIDDVLENGVEHLIQDERFAVASPEL